MASYRWVVLGAGVLLAGGLCLAPPAEAQEKLREIEFAQRTIQADYLPYGRRFILKGSALMEADTADVITLSITNARASDGAEPDFETIWLRPFKAPSTDFEIVVDRRLEFDTTYDVDLTFFRNFTFSDEENQRIK